METSERISSGVTFIGAEAPSPYHMAPRSSDNHTQFPGSSDNRSLFPDSSTSPMDVSLVSAGSVKKKRGRPRKYGADGTPLPISPSPISSSAPPLKKRGKGRLNGLDIKFHKRMGFDISGEGLAGSIGSNFTPHIITVSVGEQGPRAICILSANGWISNVTLRQPDSSGGTLTYEGRFEILSLSGSFMPTENQGTRGRSGGMSVSLASPDGRVVGGGVAGLLIAASPVQVVVGSFLPGGEQQQHQDHKPRKQKVENSHTPSTVMSFPPDKDEAMTGNGQQTFPPVLSSFGWANGHDSRTSVTDINVSG
ncbi:PREDICTED: AT-hook motif nuclear-localized protein 7 isoform X2 [Tarenaya hassleriana]|uniref:AT-hook motif nuclear-localized protein 7 isoform X2 n=1 Tax=Tarenaya hassleriana TaxID=28532 RepID=UPI00053C21A4|nr:PREDICTED: AT-hook motif nuclear-localized protein 7 isoform X2 [Tarenaya hassleriana]